METENMIRLIYKFILLIKRCICKLYFKLLMRYFKVNVKGKVTVNGMPYIRKYPLGEIKICDGVKFNSGISNIVGGDVKWTPLSRQKMSFFKVELLFPPCCVFNMLYC